MRRTIRTSSCDDVEAGAWCSSGRLPQEDGSPSTPICRPTNGRKGARRTEERSKPPKRSAPEFSEQDAKNFLQWSVVSRPLEGEPPTIDVTAGYHRANASPILKTFLSRIDGLSVV